jgi:hypothetical protein
VAAWADDQSSILLDETFEDHWECGSSIVILCRDRQSFLVQTGSGHHVLKVGKLDIVSTTSEANRALITATRLTVAFTKHTQGSG